MSDASSRTRSGSINASLSFFTPTPNNTRFFDWKRNLGVYGSYTYSRARNNTDGSFATPAAGLLAFTFSFDDYVLSAFNAGGATQTWPMVVFAAIRFGVTPAINALATMMLGVTLVLIVATGLVLRRGRTALLTERRGLGALLGLG